MSFPSQQLLQLSSWIEVPAQSDFPIQNLPMGIFSEANTALRAATRIGDTIIDLAALQAIGLLENLSLPPNIFAQATLNNFIKTGKKSWSALRQRLLEIFDKENPELRDNAAAREKVLFSMENVRMHLPVSVGDYTDFYASKEHATNVGIMFRGKENALMPNWLHLPVGYHGRASSVLVSGTPVRRPMGQMRPDATQPPVFGATRLLDFEVEMAYIAAQGKPLGERISTAEAEDYIFGLSVFNDWSARDIQSWEYVPLGPFLGKNFASSLAPWIVSLEALEPFRVAAPEPVEPLLPYLQYKGKKAFDIHLEVLLKTPQGEQQSIAKTNFKYMYWTIAQQMAHHTINGCNINAGDILASGTISGSTPDSYGSMLELTWRGQNPLLLADGSMRKFLEDGDTLTIKAWAEKDGLRIGLGEVSGEILPAFPYDESQ
ncbi:MAG: fumarylacetoacetase [Chitinophagales bacterium]|nr:fumarylacetoacetase [Bacteroidota bacterium]MCB9042879.1 fumarylacetoacetase [Chitinophagales bacterium]